MDRVIDRLLLEAQPDILHAVQARKNGSAIVFAFHHF
jgi:hypothetical protein